MTARMNGESKSLLRVAQEEANEKQNAAGGAARADLSAKRERSTVEITR